MKELKECILRFFRYIGKFKIGNAINKIIIKLINKISLNLLAKYPLVKSIFISGSYIRKNFRPFYSDIDLILIFNDVPLEKSFDCLKNFFIFFKKIRKLNPFIADFWQVMIFHKELCVFKKFWYLWGINGWKLSVGEAFYVNENLSGDKLRLLTITIWNTLCMWHHSYFKSMRDNSSGNLYPTIQKIRSHILTLNAFIALPDKYFSYQKFSYSHLDKILPNLKNNIKLSDLTRPQSYTNILISMENVAEAILNRYNSKKFDSKIKKSIKIKTNFESLEFLNGVDLKSFQFIFSTKEGIYFVLKEGLPKDDIREIFRFLIKRFERKELPFYVYTHKTYLLLFMTLPKEIIYADSKIDLKHSPIFLKERYIDKALGLIIQLKLVFQSSNFKEKLYELFWEFLRAKLALEKNWFFPTTKEIIKECQDNAGLFKNYNQTFWKVLESEKEKILKEIDPKELFNVNLCLNKDLLGILQRI